ncbi:MAG: aldehyde dehydrogenase [Firmicutes bacterium]|nr:aldehyde dehydrogenase [Bacillota bacterium]
MTIHSIVETQRAFFATGKTKDYLYRKNALLTLKKGILSYQEKINDALYQDLNKSSFESYLSEIGIVLAEISYTLKHLKKWMKIKRVKTSFTLFHAKSFVFKEPLDVALIMSPWNYPFQLAIDPLVGAIAAGNTVVVKPASYAKNTSNVIKELLDFCFPLEYVTCVLGGREENKELLEEQFDSIFFTGSSEVGKLVMEKASKHLTPVSLELGGKSPCILDKNVNLYLAAKRIAFGKFLNAGQTCVSPDYLFILPEQVSEFLKHMRTIITQFFGETPLESLEYPKIINQKHLLRLIGLLEMDKVVIGGNYSDEKFAPTIMDNITFESKVMKEEIFGPILPLIHYDSLEEVYQYISSQPKPLALYLFTHDKRVEQEVYNRLSFGGATINDTIMHFGSSQMGFGGVGASGMGKYHGLESFDTFSNKRSIVKRSNWIDLPMRYHPYSKSKFDFLKHFLK